MMDSPHHAVPHLNNSGTRMRTVAASLAFMVAVAFGVALGPVTAAHADTFTVDNMSDLSLAFTYAASGDTIVLGEHITGGSTDPAVTVPVTRTLTLNLAGFTLELEGGYSFAGLGVPDGAVLNIADSVGTGTLFANGGERGAGIGGGSATAGGTVNINGGTIHANGGDFAAGIGGGFEEAGGTVNIYEGTIHANGGLGGAGIGGGPGTDASAHPEGGTTTIIDGTVHATGGSMAAGIGGGAGGDGGTTTINNGIITANGGSTFPGGAGIGGGAGGDGGTTTINDGTVTANGGSSGAGIGGGAGGTGTETTINGGTTTAIGGNSGAGIGGGEDGAGGIAAITDGTTIATGGMYGAGIGGGYKGDGAAVSIGADATVTASSADIPYVAIGAGQSGSNFGSLSNAGTLTIPASNTITIPTVISVDNTGTILNLGSITVNGTVNNDGTIINTTGTITNPANVLVHNTTVTLDGNGGTAPANPPVVYSDTFQNGQVPFPTDATRTGYNFTGWYTTATGVTQVTDTTDLGVGGPKTTPLYAQWSAEPVTVTFDSQGGSTVAPVTGTYDSPIGEPSDPTRTGYTFTGWYTSASGGTEWNFTTPITGPTTLYAQWSADPVTFTFDTQGGNTIAPVTGTYDSPITEPADPTRTGYTFSGWYTAASGGAEWDFTTPITAPTTLYAQWQAVAALASTGTNPVPAGLTAFALVLTGLVVYVRRKRPSIN